MPPAQVFISVAEDSADMHAASLVRAAAALLPGCRFYGLTGPRMRAAGVQTLFDLTSRAAMLTGVLSVLAAARAAVREVRRAWLEQRPDLAVLLDSPELNLYLAGIARRMGIPVLYYIAPQTWASRAGRNRKIAQRVERLACILPFEEAYFRAHGVAATYVGHPLFEALAREAADPDVVAQLRGEASEPLRAGGGSKGAGFCRPFSARPTDPTKHGLQRHRSDDLEGHTTREPLVALLPGSRRHVIERVLPLQMRVAQQLRSRGLPVRIAVSAVSRERAPAIRETASRFGLDATVVVEDNASLLTAADLVLVASGTATLHVARYRKPMIVLYDAGAWLEPLHALFGRRLLSTPHLSLVNVLAGRRVVPEFMPYVPDVDAVADVAAQLLRDGTWRRLMVAQLDELVRPLESSSASENVCRLIGELLGRPLAAQVCPA
jgi:lipid-A-disaccharide synthase